jgi:hypothetical protein
MPVRVLRLDLALTAAATRCAASATDSCSQT